MLCHSERSEEPMHFACTITPQGLSRPPTSRIPPAVEAGDHNNPIHLNLEEYSVGKAPHSCTATAPVDDRKLQWMLRDCLNRGLDRQCETLSQLQANVVIP